MWPTADVRAAGGRTRLRGRRRSPTWSFALSGPRPANQEVAHPAGPTGHRTSEDPGLLLLLSTSTLADAVHRGPDGPRRDHRPRLRLPRDVGPCASNSHRPRSARDAEPSTTWPRSPATLAADGHRRPRSSPRRRPGRTPAARCPSRASIAGRRLRRWRYPPARPLLTIDATHTFSAGPGGMTYRDGLAPDIVVHRQVDRRGRAVRRAYGLSDACVRRRGAAAGRGGRGRHRRCSAGLAAPSPGNALSLRRRCEPRWAKSDPRRRSRT